MRVVKQRWFLILALTLAGAATASVTNVWQGTNGALASAGASKINPWRYNSSSPVHNPKSFDLWVDIPVAGKINRISNWNKQYEVVPLSP